MDLAFRKLRRKSHARPERKGIGSPDDRWLKQQSNPTFEFYSLSSFFSQQNEVDPKVKLSIVMEFILRRRLRECNADILTDASRSVNIPVRDVAVSSRLLLDPDGSIDVWNRYSKIFASPGSPTTAWGDVEYLSEILSCKRFVPSYEAWDSYRRPALIPTPEFLLNPKSGNQSASRLASSKTRGSKSVASLVPNQYVATSASSYVTPLEVPTLAAPHNYNISTTTSAHVTSWSAPSAWHTSQTLPSELLTLPRPSELNTVPPVWQPSQMDPRAPLNQPGSSSGQSFAEASSSSSVQNNNSSHTDSSPPKISSPKVPASPRTSNLLQNIPPSPDINLISQFGDFQQTDAGRHEGKSSKWSIGGGMKNRIKRKWDNLGIKKHSDAAKKSKTIPSSPSNTSNDPSEGEVSSSKKRTKTTSIPPRQVRAINGPSANISDEPYHRDDAPIGNYFAASGSSGSSEEAFDFMGLPESVRLRIYKFCLTREEPIIIRMSTYEDSGRQKEDLSSTFGARTLHGRLVRCCKTIHVEALPVLYGQNQFILHASREGIETLRNSRKEAPTGRFVPVFPLYIARLIKRFAVAEVEGTLAYDEILKHARPIREIRRLVAPIIPLPEPATMGKSILGSVLPQTCAFVFPLIDPWTMATVLFECRYGDDKFKDFRIQIPDRITTRMEHPQLLLALSQVVQVTVAFVDINCF
ncbi:hypothetical protein G7Y89_g6228 [Cudoniella acicularis]|uniref:Uncharacterized protein n=1 Tax=Cudoniella acicularis TaxID=354080 RepID=A0A8H4W4Y6_9HELO|nr:hypothetical protein G7Y89_g6228 [Cudoniella acicularis]